MRLEDEIVVGTAYYPEHWPQQRWEEDLRLMQQAGITVVRLAELAWSRMEPTDGNFDFDWLEEFISMAHSKGMRVVLGTPTEASPVWLRHEHPEVVSINADGLRSGGRGQHCHNSPTFRFYAGRIAQEMSRRFDSNPAVIGWQIDNELKGVPCYCESCAAAFRLWLQKRYGTIEELNRRWGTHFWSQTYNSWEQVRLPSHDQLTISTSQVVDFKRFISDTTVNFLQMQADIIRKNAPGQFITHNIQSSLYSAVNMYDLADKLDFMGWDTYPHVDDTYEVTALGHDLARGTRHQSYWMMEQKNGYFNGSDYNLALEPGIVRAWAYQDIARGANGILFYRWRANRWGQEQNPNGILRHDGTPRRAYDEIARFCREVAPFSQELAKTKVHAPVALLQNYSDIWAHEAKRQYTNISYDKVMMEYYEALLQLGVTPDVVQASDEDLSRYRVVFAPNLMLISRQEAENLKRYVANGGHVVVGVRAGMKNEDNVVVDTPWPGLLRELCGVTVDEFEALPPHVPVQVTYEGYTYTARMWADVLTAEAAVPQVVYANRFYQGKPAVTSNRYGKGDATYFGVAGCPELLKAYFSWLLPTCGVDIMDLPKGVYATMRESEKAKFLFFINMTREKQHIDTPLPGIDCITGAKLGKTVPLNPLGVVMARCD